MVTSGKMTMRRIVALGIVAMLSTTAILGVHNLTYGEETQLDSETNETDGDKISVDPTGLQEGFSAVLYDNSNGLPTSEANAIAKTSDGFLWIGSYAGLIRYDGNTFERMDSTEGLTSVKCLYVDSKDRLWIGTNDNGVAMLHQGELRKWGKLDGMNSAHTRAIAEADDGTIYIATTCGIATIDKDLQLGAIADARVEEGNFREIRKGVDGIMYATTDSGDLLLLKDGQLLRYISAEDSPLEGAGSIMPDPNGEGKLYQEAPDFGLYHVDLSDGFKVLEKIDIEPLRYIRSMEYIDGKTWICAGNGIGVLENGHFQLLENLPMDNNVDDVMTDYLGNLWFTSTRQGVMKVVPNQFSDIFTRYNIPEAVVNSTCMCEDILYIATDTGLLAVGKNGPITKLPLTKAVTASGENLEATDLLEMLTDNRIRSVIKDSKNRIWISTWRGCGLLCYDHGTVTVYTEEDGLLSDDLRAVSEREDGAVLVAVTGGVNVIKDNRVVEAYDREDGFETEESLSVEEGLNGEILVGSNGGGLYIVSDGEVKNVNVEDGLPSDIIMRVKADPERNVVWIVTSSALAYMTPDYQVTTINKFPYSNNFDLYENSKGDIWVLSSNGIYVAPAADMLSNEPNPVYYSKANGLPCIATANSYSDLTETGDLYIAGSTGVGKVNIEKSLEEVDNLRATVPYVEVDGERVYPDEKGTFTIPSTTRKLTVPSFVFNYSLSDPQVSYELQGFDTESTTVFRSNLLPVDYTNLRGGSYNFVLQLKDAMGRGNKQVVVHIVKEKAVYEQLWFMVLCAILGLLLIIAVITIIFRRKVQRLEKKNREARELFGQTAEALSSAIDAKDPYTNGHSHRVAEYSQMIAKEAGLPKEEVEKVYFAALLHDVGKIGVPNDILTKKGKLNDDEFAKIKEHPVIGGRILENIRRSPWLSIGARYHHERYNGKGYPEGLSGEDIPKIARIIAVADSYDAMTSNRSYRNAIPQHIVREEIVKGMGSQFDPHFAEIMIRLIDRDLEYAMQEKNQGLNVSEDFLRCKSMYEDCSPGFAVVKKRVHISLCNQPDEGASEGQGLPTLVLFDSLDGVVHPGEEENRNVLYHEYAKIRMDGKVTEGGVRKTEVRVSEASPDFARTSGETEDGKRYEVYAVRYKDHAMVKILDEDRTISVILALPDTSRYFYVAISGEKCSVHNIIVDNETVEIGPDTIPRIAEEISFIQGQPEGDIPNVQVDNWCTEVSRGIPVRENMELRFHARSLPTARVVWHCPFIKAYSSGDGQVGGEGYHEYVLLMLDGEIRQTGKYAQSEIHVEHNPDYGEWRDWLAKNKQGMEYLVKIRREQNKVYMDMEVEYLAMHTVTTLSDGAKEIYLALTGDQTALTDIHVE